MKDPYKLLGVPIGASREEVVASYDRARARLLSEQATDDQFEELEAAFSILSETMQRTPVEDASSDSRQSGALMRTASSMAVAQPQTGLPGFRGCPNCSTLNPINATICAECGWQFSRSCPNCGAHVEMGQPVCPRCQTVIAEYEHRSFSEAANRTQKTEQERRALDARAPIIAEEYWQYVWKSAVFWILVLAAIGLCVLIWFTQFSGRG